MKAKREYEVIKKEKEKELEEKRKKFEEAEKKREIAKKKRRQQQHNYKLTSKRGQPLMKFRVEKILNKLQGNS